MNANHDNDDTIPHKPISEIAHETITTKSARKIETEASEFENFRSQLVDLGIRVSRLENVENTKRIEKSGTDIERPADEKQLLAETAELREAIDILRSKVSHFESVECSLRSKIAEIEVVLRSNLSERGSISCNFEGVASGEAWEEDSEVNIQDKEVVEEDETLPNDTFSFMVISQTFSIPLFLSLIVVFFQITAFALVASSIIVVEDSKNPFSIPANVTSTVRFTQIVAIIIALITQDDIRTGLNLFLKGYETESLCKAFPAATPTKWTLSIIARLMEGSLSLVVTFLLIMTVETVVDLLLNFTAMAFVSQLDEVCFFMCRQGFFGSSNAIAAKVVADTKFRRQKDERGKGHIHRTIFLIFLLVVLFAGWFTIAQNQSSGKYQCSSVFVQFADESYHVLGTFSGLYDQRTSGSGIFSARNFEYVHRLSGIGVISYCEAIEAWTFSINNGEGYVDPCKWVARSEQTSTFDLIETASLTWIVRNSIFREAVLEPFFLSCYDCDDVVTPNGYDSRCSGRGRCENAVCSCNDGWYGLRCEFREPCQMLEFDDRFGPFRGNHKWSSVFSRFEVNDEFVDKYDRPVYINEYSDGAFDILVFLGRRWAATYSALLPFVPDPDESAKEALARYLREDFHPPFGGDFSIALTTEPVSVGTSGDSTSPIGLAWYAFPSDVLRKENTHDELEDIITEIPSMLLCAVCDDTTNACLYDGKCVNGRCHCSIGSSGALCQIPPVGNGRCDLFYNTPQFEYDGGDCCESTCVSTQFTCGKDESGFVDLGYFFCHLTVEGWRVNGESVIGDTNSGSGHVVQLSGNGNVLAVSEPLLDRVLLFDKVGAQWIKRGRHIEGSPQILFGASVSMSSDLDNMVSNPITTVPVKIAVGNSYHPTLYVSVFDCSSGGCSQFGDDIAAIESRSPILGAVDLSKDGGILVAGARPIPSPDSKSIPYPLAVLLWDTYVGDWTRQKLDIPFRESEGVYSVAISASGDILAIASFDAGFSAGSGLWIANNTKRVYVWRGTFWAQRGNAIVEATAHRSLLFDMQGQSMDLSLHGNVLAVGLWMKDDKRGTHARIFAWDDSEFDWIQRGSPISCGGMELQGWSISLSSDGAIVAIGAADYGGEGLGRPIGVKGEICSFRWDGTEWESLGSALPGSGWSSVALSASGSELAVSNPGQSLVYKSPRSGCSNGKSLLRVSVTTDANPQSTTWTVASNDTGEMLLQGGPYMGTHIFASYVYETCIVQSDCSIFTIYDNLDLAVSIESNGINTPGGYALFLDGKKIPGGNVTTAVERVHIGSCMACPVGTKLFRMLIQTCAPIAWSLVSSSGEVLFSQNSFDNYFYRFDNNCDFANQTTYWEEACLSLNECSLFSILTPPVKMLYSTGGSDDKTGTGLVLPNLQYHLYFDEDEIASNTTQVFNSSEQNESVASVTVGNCMR